VTVIATALWIEAPGRAALRRAPLGPPGEGEVLVATRWSAVSRGTERIVFSGRVPPGEHDRMRCPFQEGAFPAPVMYGYAAVGVVETGPEPLLGRTVFSLSPHRDRMVLPADAVMPVPDGVPARRATLAANMETALNVVWDAGIGPGDRVAVVGAGLVGLLVARLAARIPGTAVTIADIEPSRAAVAACLGVSFATPDRLPADCDVAINTSASAAGLAAAIACAGLEATVVEASWHGAGEVPVPLGGAFHSRRLRLTSSQVGRVPAERSARWSHRRRLETALALLDDPALDTLVSGETAFADAARDYPAILSDPGTIAHVFRY
jgi:NADPH:quinone reductase-like Zn-dependent oxidoreductase